MLFFSYLPFTGQILRHEFDGAVCEVDLLLVLEEGDVLGLAVVPHLAQGEVPLRESKE